MLWRDVVGYEGLYQVSDRGWIKSLPRVVVRSDGRTQLVKGRILWENKKSRNYHLICLCRNGDERWEYVHRIVALAFVPNPKGKPEVSHQDGTRWNNAASNLKWMDRKEHMSFDYREGRIPKPPSRQGEDHPFSKLTNKDTIEICRLARTTPVSAIASRFKVTPVLVRMILKGRVRSSVTGICPEPISTRKVIPIEQIKEIVAKYDTGKYTQIELGEMYGIHQGTVSSYVLTARRKGQTGVTPARVKE